MDNFLKRKFLNIFLELETLENAMTFSVSSKVIFLMIFRRKFRVLEAKALHNKKLKFSPLQEKWR